MLAFEDNEGLEAARARNILDALREDMGLRDHTAQLVPDRSVTAQLVVREPAVLCGCDWFEGCLLALDADAQVHWAFEEGDDMPADAVVCRIQARARALLTAERPAMNFLQTLSATATTTRAHVAAIRGASPNPQGCQVSSFKAPSAVDLDHDFLWRANQCLPERGRIGIFNRSYYEETLV
ncbi:MAG: hypothetical protein ACO3X3_07775, partial [Burkholderiaceae bacterium]